MAFKKIDFIAYSDHSGGANKAAYRVFESLKNYQKNNFYCLFKFSNNQNVVQLPSYYRIIARINRSLLRISRLNFKGSPNSLVYIPNDLSFLKGVNSSNVLNFHWCHFGFIGTNSILNLKKRIILLTLHDLNLILGIKHYHEGRLKTSLLSKILVRIRVNKINKSPNIHLIAPSNWMKSELEIHGILKSKIHVIPYAIDFQFWRNTPYIKGDYILFGSAGGSKDLRKGFDLLIESMKKINFKYPIGFLGGLSEVDKQTLKNVNYIDFGHVKKESELKEIYRKARIVCIPSREDNLPLVAMESLSMRKPIVAFSIGGMPDLIVHEKNGYLVEPFNISDFACCIEKAYSLSISEDIYLHSYDKFNPDVISKKYDELLEQINNHNHC